jgi:hypothetical protein
MWTVTKDIFRNCRTAARRKMEERWNASPEAEPTAMDKSY